MTSGEGRLRNLNRIVEQVSKEKGLDRSIVVSALEEAMLSAAAMSCSRSCHPRSWAARAHVAPKRAEETALAAAAEAVAGAAGRDRTARGADIGGAAGMNGVSSSGSPAFPRP